MTDYQTRISKAILDGDVTINGIPFEWDYAGSEGASFLLLLEPHHTSKEIREAKQELYRDRDVVDIRITRGYTRADRREVIGIV